jgi:hypothetical protein
LLERFDSPLWGKSLLVPRFYRESITWRDVFKFLGMGFDA